MKFIYVLFSVLLVTASCKKEVILDKPDFKVSATSVTFKKGEEGKFSFEGTAGIISFYSGETGSEYSKRLGENGGLDVSKNVKGISDDMKDTYAYTYVKAGVYKAYFIGKNLNIYGEKEVVSVVDVTVVD